MKANAMVGGGSLFGSQIAAPADGVRGPRPTRPSGRPPRVDSAVAWMSTRLASSMSGAGELRNAAGDQLGGPLDLAGGGPAAEGEAQRCEGAFGGLAHGGQHG